MGNEKTCGPSEEEILGQITKELTYFYGKYVSYRKAYRVLRNEVRRLRARSPLEVFYENAFRLCGIPPKPRT